MSLVARGRRRSCTSSSGQVRNSSATVPRHAIAITIGAPARLPRVRASPLLRMQPLERLGGDVVLGPVDGWHADDGLGSGQVGEFGESCCWLMGICDGRAIDIHVAICVCLVFILAVVGSFPRFLLILIIIPSARPE